MSRVEMIKCSSDACEIIHFELLVAIIVVVAQFGSSNVVCMAPCKWSCLVNLCFVSPKFNAMRCGVELESGNKVGRDRGTRKKNVEWYLWF
jgi:hypothetical protein